MYFVLSLAAGSETVIMPVLNALANIVTSVAELVVWAVKVQHPGILEAFRLAGDLVT
jgi:hypothetical protein